MTAKKTNKAIDIVDIDEEKIREFENFLKEEEKKMIEKIQKMSKLIDKVGTKKAEEAILHTEKDGSFNSELIDKILRKNNYDPEEYRDVFEFVAAVKTGLVPVDEVVEMVIDDDNPDADKIKSEFKQNLLNWLS